MHERLDGPEVDTHHKASEVTGHVVMVEQLGQLHLMLDLLKLFRGQKFKVDVPHCIEEVCRFVLGYQDPGLATETNTYINIMDIKNTVTCVQCILLMYITQ